MMDGKNQRVKIIAIIPILVFGLWANAIVSNADNGSSVSASLMRLEKIIGSIKLTNASGNELQIIEKMRLNSGDHVCSQAKSYAFISLDENIAVKLDAKSEAVITENNKKYEVILQSGNLLFDVEKALQADEGFEIKTANMTMGIRGTCAQVERKSNDQTSISLLDGSLSCTVTDPITGNSQSIQLSPGDHADFYTGSAYANGCQIIIRKVLYEDLRGFILQHIYDHKETALRIYEQSGIDLRNLTQEQADAQLVRDEGGEVSVVNTGRVSPTSDYYRDQ